MSTLKNSFIKINKFTRPGYTLSDLRGIVFHWTANPGATAKNHFTFFNSGGGGRYAGAHIFIDRKESLLLVPLNEVCYHSNERSCRVEKLKASKKIGQKVRYWDANLTTIGIELCVEKDGTIHPETLARAVDVTRELMKDHKLTVNDLYRHYDVTRKDCPRPFVKDPVEWTRFKSSIVAASGSKPNIQKPSVVAPSQPQVSQTGFVSIKSPTLNIRAASSFEAKIVGVAKEKQFYRVHESKNGMYRIGKDQWISAGDKYVKFFAQNDQIGIVSIKSWTPSSDTLNVRSSASLSGKVVGKLKQKTSWKVYDYTEDFVRVGKDQWISRNSKYVTVKFGI